MRRCPRCHNTYEPEARFCPVDGTATVPASAAPTEVIDLLIGRTLGGRYRIARKIGQGGMGAVYQAEHIGLGKAVAVKVLLERFSYRRDTLARFHKEARAASQIAHENIVDVIDVGEEEGRAYIVMELVEGRDLSRVLHDQGAVPAARALAILRQICRGLAAAHQKGIIHRDMKPENIFLAEREGRHDLVKLMDFGISKVRQAHEQSARLTETGAVIGTPMYMAPEQARGDANIDHRVDVYAVGVLAYEMLVGEPPFNHPTYLQLLAAHMSEKPPPPRGRNPTLSTELERVLLRALEKEPRARFQTISELEEALARVADGRPTLEERPTGQKPTVARRSAWPLAAGLAVLALAVATWLVLPRYLGQPEVVVVPMAARAPQTQTQPQTQPQPSPPPQPKPAAPPAVARVTLITDPPGATAYIDRVAVGTTPLSRELPPGEHALRFELSGYEPRQVQRKFEPGENRDVDVALERASAPPPRPKKKPRTEPAEDSHKPNPYQ